MKPYTCPSTRMDVAALLTDGDSLCRRSRTLRWKCREAEAVPSELRCEGNAAGYHMLVFFSVCFVFFPRDAPGCFAPLYQDLRQSTNGPVPLPVSLFEYNWLMSRLPEQNGLCYFHSATAWRELLLIGSVCSHGNAGCSISASRGNIAGQASSWSMLTGKLLIYLYFYRKNTLCTISSFKNGFYVYCCSRILELVQTFAVMTGSLVKLRSNLIEVIVW